MCTGNFHVNPYEISVNQVREFEDIAKEKDEQKNKKKSTKVRIILPEKSVRSARKARGQGMLAVIESTPKCVTWAWIIGDISQRKDVIISLKTTG
jgi:hypothetical protein